MYFCYFLPFEKGVAIHLKKFEFSASKDALCYVKLKFAQWLRFLNIFSLCRYYLPLEKGVVLYVYEET